jgi:hypothetical protein
MSRRKQQQHIEHVPPVPTVCGAPSSVTDDAVLDREVFARLEAARAAERAQSDRTVHAKLVTIGRAWLERRCAVVISEMASQREEADGIGWSSRGSILIECKASRTDFLVDAQKHFRRHPEFGMGSLRYFLAPTGLLKPDELPERWGLLEYTEGHAFPRKVKQAIAFPAHNLSAENKLLISALRRIGMFVPHGDGTAVWSYKYQTKKKAVLGVRDVEEQELTEDDGDVQD